MRFPIVSFISCIALVLCAQAAPQDRLNELRANGQIVLDKLMRDGDEGDICPKFNVHCSKDGENVGDLGALAFNG